MNYRSYTYLSFMTALLIALTISGCAGSKVLMYEGEEVEAGKQAIIRVDQEGEPEGILGIVSVDGKVTHPVSWALRGWATKVAVLPGKHDIIVRIEYPFSDAATKVWVVAEAGETYLVKSQSTWNTVKIWIENERTGQPTGGVSGSDDEPRQNRTTESGKRPE